MEFLPNIPAPDVELIHAIVRVMVDPEVNPYGGTMPVERVQNLVRHRHRTTYDRVVEKAKRNRRHAPYVANRSRPCALLATFGVLF